MTSFKRDVHPRLSQNYALLSSYTREMEKIHDDPRYTRRVPAERSLSPGEVENESFAARICVVNATKLDPGGVITGLKRGTFIVGPRAMLLARIYKQESLHGVRREII